MEDPAPFPKDVRNAGLLDLDLFNSKFPARLWSKHLAIETAAERNRLRVLWTKFSSSSSLKQCLMFSSATLCGIYSYVILFWFSPDSSRGDGPAWTQFVDTNIVSCWQEILSCSSWQKLGCWKMDMSKCLSSAKKPFFSFHLLLLILRLITMLKFRSWWSWYQEEIVELKIK